MKLCLCGHIPKVDKSGDLFRVICPECGRHGTKSYKESIAVEVWDSYMDFLSGRRATNTL